MSVWEKIYERINWKNEPDLTTPINATNLNIMDKGIDDLDDRVIALDGSKVDKYKDIPNPIDLNTLTETGFYSIPDLCTNRPSGANGGGLATVQVISTHVSSTNAYIVQIFYNQLQVDNVQQVYFRIGYGTIESPTFLSWQIMAVSSDLKDIAQGIGNMWDLGSYVNVSLLYSLGFPTHMYPAAQQGSNAYALDVLSGTVYENIRMGESSWVWQEQYQCTLITDSIPDVSGTKTVTGNPMTINDSAPVNAVNLSIDLEPIQDLHGYDNPWVGGAGKNKLPMTVDGIKSANTSGSWNENTYTWRGITYELITDTDGNITQIATSGTATDLSYLIVANSISVSQETILNGCPSGGSYSNSYSLALTTSNGSLVVSDDGNGVNISNSYSDVNVRIYFRNGTNGNNKVFKPMIRLSTETDNTFEPYTNICPISGRTEENVVRAGVNQWDEEWELGYWNHGNKTASNTNIRSKNKIPVFPNTTYYSNVPLYYSCYDKNGDFLTLEGYDAAGRIELSSAGTFTIPSNAYYITFNMGSTYGSTYNHDISINYPSTYTDYHAYAGKTYTIQFGQTVYKAYVDATRGKLVIIGAEVDLGSFKWNYANGVFYVASGLPTKLYSATEQQNLITSLYKAYLWIDFQSVTYGIAFQNNSATLRIKDARYTDATQFKTAVTGQTLVYELATSIEIDLTPTQIKMLENTNTLYTDYEGDTIHIEYQPNNAIGEAVRAVEESYDAEFEARPVLKKIDVSGTTNSQGQKSLIGKLVIPIAFIESSSNYCVVDFFKTGNAIGGLFRTASNNAIMANTSFSGTLYYYEI